MWLLSIGFGSAGFGLIASSIIEEVSMGLSDQDKKNNFIKGVLFIFISFASFYTTVISFV
jgi:hypothetical protein